MQPSFLELPDNRRIAYRMTEGKLPCVMFLGGFKSDMKGTKVTRLETFCVERGQRFVRFDYSGHGESGGDFLEGTIGDWKRDALAILDHVGAEKNILVGSSMGAWIALLCALERPEKLSGLVGVASAPDFTENLIWKKLRSKQKEKMKREGVYYAPSCYGEEPYPITMKLIEEAREHLLLDKPIDLNIPIRLLHGTKDEDVPYQIADTILARISSKDTILTLIKDGDHRLSNEVQLEILCDTVDKLCKREKMKESAVND